MADVRWAPVVDMHTSKVNSDRTRSPRFWVSDLGLGWWGGGVEVVGSMVIGDSEIL